MRGWVVCVFLVLAACARPLTEAEERMAQDVFGPTLDTSKIRIANGAGILPPIKTRVTNIIRVTGTDEACLRVAQTQGERQPSQAFAIGNRLHFHTGLYSSDMVLAWPGPLRFPQALVFTHEIAHAWQWQNRARTGYTPFRAGLESLQLVDPYFAPPGEAPFFSFGYEQQAAIIEDYICFIFANPNHPRRYELRAILEPVFPVDQIDRLGR
ncbi:hypothetical protein N9L47_08240 [Rhodobacteraceae bacterium]|nr:hypothetical protein [Paracoccaceae bacterium]